MPFVALTVAVLAGGCAANSGPSKVAGPVSAYPGDPVPRPAVTQVAKVEIEADGLPAQLAPKTHPPVPDEPTEPWSPNYGAVRGDVPQPRPAPAKVSALVPPPRAATLATEALNRPSPPLDADDVIRMAVAAHEMRHR